MSHIFNDKKFMKLENPGRIKLMPSDVILSYLKIQKGDIIADVGCGIGYFAFPFADSIGENGSVKASDISSIMVEELRKRVESREYKNIEVIKSSPDDSGIKNESVNLFFTSTLIHELDNLDTFTDDAIKTLKCDGKIAYFDFEKKETGFGPSVEKRISSKHVMDMFEAKGLVDVVKYDISDVFYLVIGKKSSDHLNK